MKMHENFDGNPYSEPAKCGLEIVDCVQDESLSYEFDIFCLWKVKGKKKFYYLSDSGCSCPSPFEDIHCIDALVAVKSAAELKKALDAWSTQYDRKKADPVRIAEFVRKFKKAKG